MSAVPTSDQDWTQWLFEHELVTRLLSDIERAERAALVELGCERTDAVAVYAILKGEEPEPWPATNADANRSRARLAMFAISWAAKARMHLTLGHENARLAAHAAILAGLYASTGTAEAVLEQQHRAAKAELAQEHQAGIAAVEAERAERSATQKSRREKGGRVRGEQIASEAREHDEIIRKLLAHYRLSVALQDDYRTPVTYIHETTGIAVRTIRRRIKIISGQ